MDLRENSVPGLRDIQMEDGGEQVGGLTLVFATLPSPGSHSCFRKKCIDRCICKISKAVNSLSSTKLGERNACCHYYEFFQNFAFL